MIKNKPTHFESLIIFEQFLNFDFYFLIFDKMILVYIWLFGIIAFVNYLIFRNIEKRRDEMARQYLEYKKKQLYWKTRNELDKLEKWI